MTGENSQREAKTPSITLDRLTAGKRLTESANLMQQPSNVMAGCISQEGAIVGETATTRHDLRVTGNPRIRTCHFYPEKLGQDVRKWKELNDGRMTCCRWKADGPWINNITKGGSSRTGSCCHNIRY